MAAKIFAHLGGRHGAAEQNVGGATFVNDSYLSQLERIETVVDDCSSGGGQPGLQGKLLGAADSESGTRSSDG